METAKGGKIVQGEAGRKGPFEELDKRNIVVVGKEGEGQVLLATRKLLTTRR